MAVKVLYERPSQIRFLGVQLRLLLVTVFTLICSSLLVPELLTVHAAGEGDDDRGIEDRNNMKGWKEKRGGNERERENIMLILEVMVLVIIVLVVVG
jgi:hypothetical protein